MDFSSSGSVTERYLYNPYAQNQFYGQVNGSGTTEWFVTDNLNSIRQVLSASGTSLATMVYDPFGQLLTSLNSYAPRFLYTGGAYDAITGMYTNGAREENPADGHWMSQDPMGLGPDSNSYRYVGNDTPSAIDPNGLEPIKWVPAPVSGSKSKYDLPKDWSPRSLYTINTIHVVVLGEWRGNDRAYTYISPSLFCLNCTHVFDMKDYANPNVNTVVSLLEKNLKPGTIGILTLSSHGINDGGIRISENQHLTANTDREILRRISHLLSADAVVILDSCCAGAYEEACQKLANELNVTVVATPDFSYLPSNFDLMNCRIPETQWKAFRPTKVDSKVVDPIKARLWKAAMEPGPGERIHPFDPY